MQRAKNIQGSYEYDYTDIERAKFNSSNSELRIFFKQLTQSNAGEQVALKGLQRM